MTNGATPSNNSNSPIRQAYTDTKKSIMKPFSDLSKSFDTSTISKFCQATWNNPLEFLGRTVATGVIGAIGLAGTVAAFNAWLSLAAIGGVVAAVGLVLAGPAGIAPGLTIASGPIGVAAATVGIIIANYADFIKNNRSQTEENTSAANDSVENANAGKQTPESSVVKYLDQSSTTAERLKSVWRVGKTLLKENQLSFSLLHCLKKISTEETPDGKLKEDSTELFSKLFPYLNSCSEEEKSSTAYQECLEFAKIADDGTIISFDPDKLTKFVQNKAVSS